MRPLAPWLVPLCVTACAPKAARPAGAPKAVTTESADATAIQVDALLDAARASHHAFEVVTSLTDQVGPRMAGSPGDKAAVAWAVRAMPESGLAGVHAEPVTVPAWVRGEESGAIVAPVQQTLALLALGGSVGTTGLEAEVVEMTTLDALKAADAVDAKKVAGKIVFLSTPMQRTKSGADYGRVVAIRSRGAAEAAKLGAVGVLIRSVGTDHERLPHTGIMRPAPIPAAALAAPDAEMLSRLLTTGRPVRVRMTLGAHMDPDARSANVVGEIRGRERPTESVVLGAHLDSWDPGRGAIDDGAGCAIALEAARLIAARRPPRRTVRVVLFADEEQGIFGAKEFAKAHAEEVPHIVAALEADLGADRVYAVRVLGGAAAPTELSAIATALGPLEVKAEPESANGGADVSPLRALGVPVVDLRQDATRYFDVHHSANDTLDKIDPDALEQAAAAYAATTYILADAPLDMGRVPKDKREGE